MKDNEEPFRRRLLCPVDFGLSEPADMVTDTTLQRIQLNAETGSA